MPFDLQALKNSLTEASKRCFGTDIGLAGTESRNKNKIYFDGPNGRNMSMEIIPDEIHKMAVVKLIGYNETDPEYPAYNIATSVLTSIRGVKSVSPYGDMKLLLCDTLELYMFNEVAIYWMDAIKKAHEFGPAPAPEQK